MSFWTNQEYNQIKVLLIIAIVAVGGIFAYKFAGNPDSINQGSVLQGTNKNGSEMVRLSTTFNEDGTCVLSMCASASENTKEACVDLVGNSDKFEGGDVCKIDDSVTGSTEATYVDAVIKASKNASATQLETSAEIR